jgi:hypothetical protein
MKRLKLDFLVATNRTVIVATMVPGWNRVLLSRQGILRLPRQLRAFLMLCGCRKIIVKPGGKVITIEPSSDALSVEWVVRLFSAAFVQVCVEGGSEAAGVCGLAHFGLKFNSSIH